MTQTRSPIKYFVTRHRGAVTWFAGKGQRALKIKLAGDGFDPAIVLPGDVVIGTLPTHLAAEVCSRGGRYWHLKMDVPPEHRGRELSAEDMEAFGAQLHEFHVASLGDRRSASVEVEPIFAPVEGRKVLHVCVATDAMLANLLPALQLNWHDAVIVTTPSMRERADLLQALLEVARQRRGLTPTASPVRQIAIDEPRTVAGTTQVLRSVCEGLRTEYPDHAIEVNASGGLKLIFLPLVEVFRPHGRILYCHLEFDQLESVWPSEPGSIALKPDLVDLDTLLCSQGSRIVEQAEIDEGALRGRMRATASLALGQRWNGPADANLVRELIRWLHMLAAETERARRANAAVPMIEWQAPPNLSRWCKTLLKELVRLELLAVSKPKASAALYGITSDAAQRYLGGGYMEEFALLSVLDMGLPRAHVGLNVHIDLLQRHPHDHHRRQSELDVAVVWRNRLLVIECKAGRQLFAHDTSKPQDIVNKIGTLKTQKAGRFGSAWLVSRNPLTEEHDADVLDRMKMSQVDKVAGFKELIRLPSMLRTWCGLKGRPELRWEDQRIA